jgi:hypothetical protein
MWSPLKKAIPSVLIVENGNGDVFIVENKKTKPQVEKILKSDSTTPRKSSRRKPIEKFESEQGPSVFKL